MCARCALERPGPCREPDSAGLPPGSAACGASHWKTHPLRGSVGLPWPCTHHRCRAQLQRPFLHPSGRATDMKAPVGSNTNTVHCTFCRSSGADLAIKNCYLLCVSHRVKRRWQTWEERPCQETLRVTTWLLSTPFRYCWTCQFLSIDANWSHLNLSCIDCSGLGGSKAAWTQVWKGLLLG